MSGSCLRASLALSPGRKERRFPFALPAPESYKAVESANRVVFSVPGAAIHP
ncbi:MAG: hypothetical protein GXY42_01210 [Desulfovibrionales bacterium]|nr:hypothetical protein [Desulfovibrionales bacterium]